MCKAQIHDEKVKALAKMQRFARNCGPVAVQEIITDNNMQHLLCWI